MKINKFPEEFKKAVPILERIEKAGFEAYFVGGCVRDVLLNHPIHDVDIATSATPKEVEGLFTKTFDLGIEHGTIAVLEGGETYEITTFRTESGYEDFRRPDTVTFVRSLEEDLKRRDFTINAFAVNLNGELIDLFEGMADLKAKKLRAVGLPEERFHEDALRMMRGVRFSSQLNFTLEEKTLAAISKMHPLLEKIAVERIRVEFEKLLLGENPAVGLDAFIATQLYAYTPYLKNRKIGLTQLKNAVTGKKISNEEVAWSFLLAELDFSEAEYKTVLKGWKLSNDRIRKVLHLTHFYMLRLKRDLTSEDIYFLGAESISDLAIILNLKGLDAKLEKMEETYKRLPITSRQELNLTGKDLIEKYQKKAGAWVGESIAYIEKAVVNGLCQNETAALLDEIEAHFKWSKHLQ